MEWKRATELKDELAESTRWYWTWRPRLLGRQSYDTSSGILCLIYASGGNVLSPLADFRGLGDGLTCKDASGAHYDTWFAGPVSPGELTGAVRARVVDDAVSPLVTGEPATAPAWWWCRTNPEAPLLLVDAAQIGPIFLEEDADAVVRVFLATDGKGSSVDVGEFGFSEPLVSRGGVIDDSGELGRTEAEFFGRIPAPPALPEQFPELA
jgi:hypothetical protein